MSWPQRAVYIEWAVLRQANPYDPTPGLVKGGLRSQEEAEAWLKALELSEQNSPRSYDSGMNPKPSPMYVGSRRVEGWPERDPDWLARHLAKEADDAV